MKKAIEIIDIGIGLDEEFNTLPENYDSVNTNTNNATGCSCSCPSKKTWWTNLFA